MPLDMPRRSSSRTRAARRGDGGYQVTAHVLDTLLKHEASLLALAYHVLGEPALNSLVEELMGTNLLIKVLSEERE